MKTVTAKDFQLNQAQVMKEVAAGKVYKVTFHGKPWVELRPATLVKEPRQGSLEAFKESLAVTLEDSSLPDKPDYKVIRRQHLDERYGDR